MERICPFLLFVMFYSCKPSVPATENQIFDNKIVIGESISLFSKTLNEQRDIFISLPDNYERNIHTYPIVIVFDAEYLFELTNSIVKIKVSRNEMPESIVVGIPNSSEKRYEMAMELTKLDGGSFFGNADGKLISDYLAFIKDELIPYLESSYRINGHKTIIGMSPTFGPVLEAFWNQPDLFNGYIILAAELAVKTSTGETVAERVLHAIQDKERSRSSIYIGKASEDLKRRPKEEFIAYKELNRQLELSANPKISYKIEVLEKENHYGMSIAGIEHGIETIYLFEIWNIPYRDFWSSTNPAKEIKLYYNGLSNLYGFEILPLEESFYAAQTLLGTTRRMKRQERETELRQVLKLALEYYPNSKENTKAFF